MINSFLKLGTYFLHPIWLSTYAIIFYFSYSGFLYTYENMIAKVFAIIILTVILPILFLILLKPLKIISSFHLHSIKERRIPLLFFTSITAFILNFIFDPTEYRVPFYFFSGVFFSGMTCIILSFVNYKISLHALGISSLATFVIAFSVLYQIEVLLFISISIFCTGWVISSRLLLKSHNLNELISGVLLGIGSQLIFIQFWYT